MQLLGHGRPLASLEGTRIAGRDLGPEEAAADLRGLAERGVGLVLVDHHLPDAAAAFNHCLDVVSEYVASQADVAERNLRRCQAPLEAGGVSLYALVGDAFCAPGATAAALLATGASGGPPRRASPAAPGP
jgi:hypothetical protein